jgi:hypothetical protein
MRLATGILFVAVAGPAFGQTPQLRAPGGGFLGMQLSGSRISTAAATMADEAVALRDALTRAPIVPFLKPPLMNAANAVVAQTAETRNLASRPGQREAAFRSHQQAEASAATLIALIQRNNFTVREVSQAVTRLQYADTQLDQAFANAGSGGDGDERWRRRVARIASTLEDQAGELRALADDTLGGFDRPLDRAIRSFAFASAGVEQKVNAGASRDQIATDVSELSRRWQAVAVGLRQSVTANAAVRAQAARVETLYQQLVTVVAGPGGGGPPVAPPDFGLIPKGTAFVVGAGEGGGPRVRVYTDLGGLTSHDFFAYDPQFRGGVRVALADLNGDGAPDIVTAPGPGMPPLVRVFDGRNLSLMTEFLAYDPSWTGGVTVAAANRGRNGVAMVVTGADVGGGGQVRVYDLIAGKELDNFFPYGDQFRGGVRVACGDINGDGVPDVITAPGPSPAGGVAAGPTVRVYDGRNRRMLSQFNAYDDRWLGGLWVATGDITKNGRAEIITGAEAGGGPHVRVFDGSTGRSMSELYPFPMGFRGGVRVAAHDVNNDGVLDFICAPGPNADVGFRPPPVRVLDGRTKQPIGSFQPYEPTFRGGAYVGAK